jgi:hypothetical protein
MQDDLQGEAGKHEYYPLYLELYSEEYAEEMEKRFKTES